MLSFFKTKITFWPFINELKSYRWTEAKSDLFAAFIVALIAIPQSIAYALLAGLPPISGLYSAIFAAIFTAAFGSSRYLVAGPSTGISILIQMTIANVLQSQYPNVLLEERTNLALMILLHIVLIMGVVQIVFAFLNIKKALQFVSRSVMLGYFTGIAIAIAITQLQYLFEVFPKRPSYFALQKLYYILLNIASMHIGALIFGLVSIGLLLALQRYFKKLPNALIMLVVMGFSIYLYNQKTNFTDILSLKDLGVADTWTLSLAFPKIHWNLLQDVFLSALAISLLAILEVFSIARAISIKSAETLRINQQVFGLGISNFLLSFVPFAMPTSGSLSRSWLNFFNGAKTRFSALFSGLFILLFAYVGWIWIRYIPLVALSAILFIVIWQMIDWESIKHCIKTTIEDRVVFFLTMISCLLFSLDIAFYIGITLSIIFFLKKAAEPFIVEYGFNKAGRLKILSSKYRRYRNVRIIGMGGELFFASVDFIQDAMLQIADDPYVKAIILKLNSIYHMDASMALALLQLHEYLQGKNKILIISGVTKPVYDTMLKAEIVQKIGFEHIFLTDETKPQLSTWRAYLYAEQKAENLS